MWVGVFHKSRKGIISLKKGLKIKSPAFLQQGINILANVEQLHFREDFLVNCSGQFVIALTHETEGRCQQAALAAGPKGSHL